MKNKVLYVFLCVLIISFIITILSISYQFLKKKEADILDDVNGEVISYTVNFKLNGADKIDSKKASCMEVLDECIVHLPKASRDGGIVLGYSSDPNSTTAEYLIDTDIDINQNMTLYVISYKINTLHVEGDKLDYLSNKDVSCTVYNNTSGCYITIPTFNKEGYEIKGYSTSKEASTGYIFPNEEYEISKDIVIYPIYNISNRYQKIDIAKTIIVNDSFIEIEKGCQESVYEKYLGYLNEIKEYAPYLLFGNKITFMVDNSFNKIWGNQYVGMNYGPRKLRAFDIRCSSNIINDYYATMVHELSHSWDYYYSTKGDANITSQSDIINLFNKYSKMSNRPFRAYSYSNIYEFFADAVKYYYFKYLKPTPEFSSLSFPSDIKRVLEKYICIANNDYDESKCDI